MVWHTISEYLQERLAYRTPTPYRPPFLDIDSSTGLPIRRQVSAGLLTVLVGGAVAAGLLVSDQDAAATPGSAAPATRQADPRNTVVVRDDTRNRSDRSDTVDRSSGLRWRDTDRVSRWIARAIEVMRHKDVPVKWSDHDEIRTVIEKESSGNPRAINLWDSNAAAGHPSKGLMQTIGPTFRSYKLPGHGDIYDPVDNIIAGVRYTLDRYGGFAGHPGLGSLSAGGDYQGY